MLSPGTVCPTHPTEGVTLWTSNLQRPQGELRKAMCSPFSSTHTLHQSSASQELRTNQNHLSFRRSGLLVCKMKNVVYIEQDVRENLWKLSKTP